MKGACRPALRVCVRLAVRSGTPELVNEHPPQGCKCYRKFMFRMLNLFSLFIALLGTGIASAQDIFTRSELQDAIQTSAGCDLSERLQADLNADPLYRRDDAGCRLVQPDQSGTYYRDEGCTDGVDFIVTGQQLFCLQATNSAALGEGGSEFESTWTLSPGSTYDIGALSLSGMTQPYRQSVVYRTVSVAAGECQLLMRVYRRDLRDDQSGPALLALHGGSWRNRGFGAFGIEAAATYYASRGFVVFAPFYRLLGNGDGSPACHDATLPQIIDDVTAALTWLELNAERYGATGAPVVFGQSAGAHLALTLAVNQSARIAAAVLLYPPTDFTDLVSQVWGGAYTNPEGIGLMNLVLGDATAFDLTRSPVPENTFPARVSMQSTPPMRILHGLADELVPARQSIRLCHALAGRELSTPVAMDGQLKTALNCGANSELILFREGNHALDICLSTDPLLSALIDNVCLSGGEESRQLVASELERAVRWAQLQAVQEVPDDTGGAGTLTLSWPTMLLLAFWLLSIRYGRRGRRR